MGITSALVLFAVIWFLVFLVVIPIRLETQGDVGEVEPGTHAGAPANPNLKKKAWITTGISLVIWIKFKRCCILPFAQAPQKKLKPEFSYHTKCQTTN